MIELEDLLLIVPFLFNFHPKRIEAASGPLTFDGEKFFSHLIISEIFFASLCELVIYELDISVKISFDSRESNEFGLKSKIGIEEHIIFKKDLLSNPNHLQ